jgi:hypothetical protein
MNYEITFLQALSLTVAVECAVVVALTRLLPGVRRYAPSLTKTIAAGTIPSMATLPYLWFVVPALIHPYVVQLMAGGGAGFAGGWVVVRLILNLPPRWGARVAFSANAASILAGMIVFR